MITLSIPLAYATPINFQATLGNNQYNCTIYWLFFAKRSYISIQDQYGNLVVNTALVSSSVTPGVNPVNIIAGYFTTSAMYYYPDDQTLVIT